MKFHDYRTIFDTVRGEMAHEEFDRIVRQRIENGLVSKLHVSMFAAQDRWFRSMRPYFKVWPSVISALCRLSLSVRLSDLQLPHRTIAIRFPEGLGPCVNKERINAVLIHADHLGVRCFGDISNEGSAVSKDDKFICCVMLNTYPGTIEEDFSRQNYQLDRGVEFNPNLDLTAIRCGLTTLLLANDPSIIKPDVLSADRQKFDETGDPKYIEKAKKRGIVGWRIGEEYESIPHYRRPHFALRHTGPGRTIPRIVPVKGAVVHRDKLTRVPTGYITPDGTEVES